MVCDKQSVVPISDSYMCGYVDLLWWAYWTWWNRPVFDVLLLHVIEKKMGLKLSKLKQHKVFQNMLYVNVLTTGGLLAAGDVVTQQIEMAMDKDRTQKFNPKRTGRF